MSVLVLSGLERWEIAIRVFPAHEERLTGLSCTGQIVLQSQRTRLA
jgi:hypothetical protein